VAAARDPHKSGQARPTQATTNVVKSFRIFSYYIGENVGVDGPAHPERLLSTVTPL
jgi:hypothetical protein